MKKTTIFTGTFLAASLIGTMVGAASGIKIAAELTPQAIVYNGKSSIENVIGYDGSTYVPIDKLVNITGNTVEIKDGIIYVVDRKPAGKSIDKDKAKYTFTVDNISFGNSEYNGFRIAIVEMSFNNNSGSTQSPLSTKYSFIASQEGTELVTAFDDTVSESNRKTTVESGETLKFTQKFMLDSKKDFQIMIRNEEEKIVVLEHQSYYENNY